MARLWYNSDEVAGFHPLVEIALTSAINSLGLGHLIELVHHPAIPNSSIIPDFALRLRSSQRYIFICEVKRTERDVESQRYQNQTRSYVTEFGPYWENNYPKYFCITNIERLILLADRNGPLITCQLKGNPYQSSKFDPGSHDATAACNGLQLAFENILPKIVNRIQPNWDNNWQHIIDNFHSNFIALKNSLGIADNVAKELSLYELFRLLAYSYLKDYYSQVGNPNASHFRNYPTQNLTLPQFINSLANNYDRIIRLDFRQIFINHPDQARRIFPDNFTANYLQYFRDVIQCINQYSSSAVADNPSPAYVFNLLTSKIYEREELHRKGKIMSDSELSNLLVSLCIDTADSNVLDPGCGDGALLDAAYDRLNFLAISNNLPKTHNEILPLVNGIEIDPFLSQLAAFRLLSKNLSQVNNQTVANINIGSIFNNLEPNSYDVVIMNPPFVRNDDPNNPISAGEKLLMLNAIRATGETDFVSQATQPNLYYYFTNYVWHYLRQNGKAGLILMTKFLNNRDGQFLKKFILDKVEAIISYPRKYFQDFVVSTVIIILKNGSNSSNVSFLRISDESILLNPETVNTILRSATDTATASYRLKLVSRINLNPSDNWKQYLQDQKFDGFSNLNFLVNLKHHFDEIGRGASETGGGSSVIYPNYDVINNVFRGHGERVTSLQSASGVTRAVITFDSSLNSYVGWGIKNNFVRRNYILSNSDFLIDKAFQFPETADRNSLNGLSLPLKSDQQLDQLYTNCSNTYGLTKWRRIVNNAVNSTITPKILIPRADRNKHVVYYNPHNQPFTLSTNFIFCDSLINQKAISDELQYKFMTAFLLSAFGQIQFELNANNQEGLRKLEVFQIKRIKVFNLTLVSDAEINNVVLEFERLNTVNVEFSGDEGTNTSRRGLDMAVGNIIFSKDSLGFTSANDLVDYFELFLADLVEDRRI